MCVYKLSTDICSVLLPACYPDCQAVLDRSTLCNCFILLDCFFIMLTIQELYTLHVFGNDGIDKKNTIILYMIIISMLDENKDGYNN